MKKLYLFVIIILLSLPAYADDAVVARVNGTAITSKQLENAVDQMIPRMTFHGDVSEEKRNEFREQALEQLINNELEYQDALSKGLKPDEKQVKDQMEQIRGRFRSKREYKAALEKYGITEDELRQQVEKNMVIQTMLEKTVIGPSQMTEAAVKDYYDKNIAKFKQPESVRLRVISTKDENKAKDVLARLKTGEDFGDLAAKMSEDDYRIKGGDIGYVHRGRVLPEIENAAFKLKIGEVGGPIEAEGTWYVIRVEDKKPERLLSFDEAKAKLKKELEAKRSGELMDKWIAGLKAKAKIEILLKLQ